MRMFWRVATVLVASALAALAAGTGPRSVAASSACGVEFWSLKTLSDPQRNLVKLRPRRTTIALIDARPMPHPTPTTRATGYQRRVWRVVAQIIEFKLEDDSDIHLVLFDEGHYMIAEMPFAACLPTATRDRKAIIRARATFIKQCGPATSDWQTLGAIAYISEVGFWDFPHRQSGHASNYAELHPVTAIKIVSGCHG